jgi:hypothetical protein
MYDILSVQIEREGGRDTAAEKIKARFAISGPGWYFYRCVVVMI